MQLESTNSLRAIETAYLILHLSQYVDGIWGKAVSKYDDPLAYSQPGSTEHKLRSPYPSDHRSITISFLAIESLLIATGSKSNGMIQMCRRGLDSYRKSVGAYGSHRAISAVSGEHRINESSRHTASALLILSSLDIPYDGKISDSLKWLIGQQQANGGWSLEERGDQNNPSPDSSPDPYSTSYVIYALTKALNGSWASNLNHPEITRIIRDGAQYVIGEFARYWPHGWAYTKEELRFVDTCQILKGLSSPLRHSILNDIDRQFILDRIRELKARYMDEKTGGWIDPFVRIGDAATSIWGAKLLFDSGGGADPDAAKSAYRALSYLHDPAATQTLRLIDWAVVPSLAAPTNIILLSRRLEQIDKRSEKLTKLSGVRVIGLLSSHVPRSQRSASEPIKFILSDGAPSLVKSDIVQFVFEMTPSYVWYVLSILLPVVFSLLASMPWLQRYFWPVH